MPAEAQWEGTKPFAKDNIYGFKWGLGICVGECGVWLQILKIRSGIFLNNSLCRPEYF